MAQLGLTDGDKKRGRGITSSIKAKRQAFMPWKAGNGTRALSKAAKRIDRRAVHHLRQEADKVVYENMQVVGILPPGKSDEERER